MTAGQFVKYPAPNVPLFASTLSVSGYTLFKKKTQELWPVFKCGSHDCIIHSMYSMRNKLVVLEIKEEAVETRAEVKTFDHSKLKHVEPQEKNTLPKQSGKCELF